MVELADTAQNLLPSRRAGSSPALGTNIKNGNAVQSWLASHARVDLAPLTTKPGTMPCSNCSRHR